MGHFSSGELGTTHCSAALCTMPLSEVHRLATRKHDSHELKLSSCSSNITFEPDQELGELLWENGQLVVQEQSTRTRKNSSLACLDSNALTGDHEDGGNHMLDNAEKYGAAVDYSVSGLLLGHMSLVQEDDVVPWLNYQLQDALQKDYCPGFLTDLSGVDMNSVSAQQSVLPSNTNRCCGQVSNNSHFVSLQRDSCSEEKESLVSVSETGRSGLGTTRPFLSTQASLPSHGSNALDSLSNSSNPPAPCGFSSETIRVSSKPLPQEEDMMHPETNRLYDMTNFSHFSRPAAVVKANLQRVYKLKSDDKLFRSETAIGPMESASSELDRMERVGRETSQPIPVVFEFDLQSSRNRPVEIASSSPPEVICGEDVQAKRSRSPNHVLSHGSRFAACDAALTRADDEKGPEQVVACSSGCSGANSPSAPPKDHKQCCKRKGRVVEESDCQSEGIDDPVDAKKSAPARGTGAKRSRAAEVHNLSERRRRDRINEKMRALQELIPNCNKVDKASMLDEAIEYLKSLQLQVQMMSMGTGICMPPMLLPAGIPQMHSPHLPHISPMSVGMGMGMGVGLGLGMLDMAGPSCCPFIPVHQPPGSQFPCSSSSGSASLHGMPSSSLPMCGFAGVSMPRAPFIPGYAVNAFSTPHGSVPSTIPVLDLSGALSSSKESTDGLTVQGVINNDKEGACSQISASTQATRDCTERSESVPGSEQASHVSFTGTISSRSVNQISSNANASCDS